MMINVRNTIFDRCYLSQNLLTISIILIIKIETDTIEAAAAVGAMSILSSNLLRHGSLGSSDQTQNSNYIYNAYNYNKNNNNNDEYTQINNGNFGNNYNNNKMKDSFNEFYENKSKLLINNLLNCPRECDCDGLSIDCSNRYFNLLLCFKF
jgi:hypothetical protein